MSSSTEVSSDDSADLPEWALRALEAADARRSRPIAWDELRKEPGWPLLLDAAVVSTFLPKDLAPHGTRETERGQAEKLVLRFSQTACTTSGTAWELTRDARSAVLGSAIRSGELQAAVGRTKERFHDAVSVALRDTLTGKPVDQGEAAELGTLEARRAATALVSSVSELTPPASLDTLDRNILQRRLVEQFERMCGKDFEARIVGRSQELEELRGYVGSISAASVGAFLGRAVGDARRAIVGRQTYVLWGTGGVGKTTLISRFMLEHVRAAERNFPFAYLDFDRPSVSPRDPFGLLSEICLQVSAQFEELDKPLRELRAAVHAAQPRERGTDFDALAVLAPLVVQFRKRIDSFLDSQESFFEWSRPFLLVFDTFEVAQYDANQVDLLERFLLMFTRPPWPRLRLIISGRRRLQHFITPVEGRELEGIDLDGAASLLQRLTGEAGKPITAKIARTLASLLAIKRSRFADPRVHPLRVRMVADVFRSSDSEKGDSIAQSLIAELQSGLTGNGRAARSMIDGILVRRIIGHVADERVRALADPGLVVRRITPGVIQFVMARGTPRPGTKDPGDSLQFEPWEIGEAEAGDIFNAFAKELTLVEPEGNALRHRQDVRSEMLPLIRASSRRRFDLLHRLAFEYFEKEAFDGDEATAAEAIYHGLWSGQELERLEELWMRGRVANPRIDPEEFAPESVAAVYLKARNREGLTLQEVQRLPRSIATRWAVSFGEQFLLTTQPLEQIATIRAATGPAFEALRPEPFTSAIVARLLYRGGLWRDARTLIEKSTDDSVVSSIVQLEDSRASFARLAVALAAKAGAPPDERGTIAERFAFKDPVARAEVCSHVIIWHVRGGRDQWNEPVRAVLEEATRKVPASQWATARRILRLVLMASAEPSPELVATWVRQCERLPRDRDLAELLEKLFTGLYSQAPGKHELDRIRRLLMGRSVSAESYDELDGIWRETKTLLAIELLKDPGLLNNVRCLAAFDHADWDNVLANALARALGQTGTQLRSLLDDHGFIESRSAASAPEIVRAAVVSGRLLDLARVLALASDPAGAEAEQAIFTEPGVTFEADAYPQSVIDIARALVGWHETLLRMVAWDHFGAAH